MANLLTLENIMQDIVNGTYDNHLDKLSAALKSRTDLVRAQKDAVLKLTLDKDSRVRFVSEIRPKYLAGKEATVISVKQKKALVKVDAGEFYEKGSYLGKKINCPLSLLEAV